MTNISLTDIENLKKILDNCLIYTDLKGEKYESLEKIYKELKREFKMEKALGKIESVSFGYGGYQDMQFGLTVTLSFRGMGCIDFIEGGWSEDVKVDKYTKWTETDRSNQRVEMVKKINKLLKDANVNSIDQLKGKPIEVTNEGLKLKSWRILTEVL